MKKYLFWTVFLFGNSLLFAQKYLQIERTNIIKVQRIGVGETITYKLKGKDQMWQTKDLTDVIPEQNIALFDGQMVKMQDIAKIRKQRGFLPSMGKQFYKFGGLWLGYAALGDLFKQSTFNAQDIYVPATAFAMGFIFQKGFKYKYIRLGKNRRLRGIDLNFK